MQVYTMTQLKCMNFGQLREIIKMLPKSLWYTQFEH